MYSADVVQKIIKKFPETATIPVPEKFVRDPEAQIKVPAARLRDVATYLKTDPEMAFDLPNFMTAVDYIKDNLFEMVYYFYSTKHKNGLVVKTQISRVDASVDSLTDIWPGLDFQEREVFDLFGITFKGHYNLKRIMMWDGFPGFPLRKDYVHVTDKYDSGLEIGTPGLDEKGVPIAKDGV
jgi:NADH-quinone oxidoreductase subunit C